jgi:hypothetical protein
MAITIEHQDPAYVEHRGGFALLSYLRGAANRVEHRRSSIERAFEAFSGAEATGRADQEVGGLGLLVLQRALFAAEDLGLLLHAFAGADPWERLRAANVPELDGAYRTAVEDLDATLDGVFRLASREAIEEAVGGAEEREVLTKTRDLARARWGQMLERCAWLWLEHRNVAKATMHGFPIVAGADLDGPPRAGELAADIRAPDQRYSVALTSRVSGTHVTTGRTIVRLGSSAVGTYRRYGRTAARLTGELCELQATTTMSRHAASVPLRGARLLDARSRHIAERLADAPGEES